MPNEYETVHEFYEATPEELELADLCAQVTADYPVLEDEVEEILGSDFEISAKRVLLDGIFYEAEARRLIAAWSLQPEEGSDWTHSGSFYSADETLDDLSRRDLYKFSGCISLVFGGLVTIAHIRQGEVINPYLILEAAFYSSGLSALQLARKS